MARVLDALDGVPPGTKLLWATAAGRLPGLHRPRTPERARFWPRRSADAGSWSPTATSAGATGPRSSRCRGGSRSCPASSKDRRARRDRVDRAGARGHDPRGRRRRARRRRRRRPRRLLRGDLPARRALVQVPTTLVAQVDSAYGGKTGVDLAEAKNYVGAYHQPAAVIADTDALATLPAAELAAGYAEVVKTGLIAGGDLWERVRGGADPADPELIAACVRTKLRIVARDERDARPAPGPEPRPHGRPRDRDRHRLRALPPRRGGRARAAGGAAAVRPGRPARRGPRAARRPWSADHARRTSIRTRS